MKSPPYTSYSLLLVDIQILHLCTLKLHFQTPHHSDHATMVLQLNSDHVMY